MRGFVQAPRRREEQWAQRLQIWSRFPIKEMYRRGWFPEFFGSSREAEANAESLIRPLVTLASRPWAEALHRKHVRSGSRLDEYALLAWECRVLSLAQRQQAQAFDASKITKEWFSGLVQLSGEEQSAIRAKEYLADAGITMVVEPHLPQTYLDGACIATTSRQVVIGMTLRFDRLDNFWFVLLHELAHAVLHLYKIAIDSFFDDLEATVTSSSKKQTTLRVNLPSRARSRIQLLLAIPAPRVPS